MNALGIKKMQEVRLRWYEFKDGTFRMKIVGNKHKDINADYNVMIEGMALMTHIAGKYNEVKPKKMQEDTISYLSQAFVRHTSFDLTDPNSHPKHSDDIQQPNNGKDST